jgi:isoleucyl-tRNA synthetase
MIAETLVRLVAPLLSFTADEIWQYLPVVSNRLPSVHLELFLDPASLAPSVDAEFVSDWATLLLVRDEALKSLEEARKEKLIGKALDARLVLEVPETAGAVLERYRGSLKELLNVSQVEVITGPSAQIIASTLPAEGKKCERCWNYSVHVGEDWRWPTVCERCSAALGQMNLSWEETT